MTNTLDPQLDPAPAVEPLPARGRLLPRRTPRAGSGPKPVQLGIGVVLLSTIVAMAVVVPFVSPYGAEAIVGGPLLPPDTLHWFGTDALGRDLFTRVFAAARVDLMVVLLAGVPVTVVGTLIGAAVALIDRPWLSSSLMRATDVVMAFPGIVLALFLTVILDSGTPVLGLPAGLPAFLLALYLIGWAFYARIASAETLALRGLDFVQVTRVLGYSPLRRLRRHILPQVFGATVTLALTDMVGIIAALAALPFLGAGIQPPTPEWGAMMYEGRTVMEIGWWVTLFPALALLCTGVGFVFVGDSLISRKGRA